MSSGPPAAERASDSSLPSLRQRAPSSPRARTTGARGYVRCTLSGDAWTSEYRIVPTVRQRGVPATTLATFAVENGRAGAVESSV